MDLIITCTFAALCSLFSDCTTGDDQSAVDVEILLIEDASYIRATGSPAKEVWFPINVSAHNYGSYTKVFFVTGFVPGSLMMSVTQNKDQPLSVGWAQAQLSLHQNTRVAGDKLVATQGDCFIHGATD